MTTRLNRRHAVTTAVMLVLHAGIGVAVAGGAGPPDREPVAVAEWRRDSYFQAPAFWKADWTEVNAYLDQVKKGEVWPIGHSQGSRAIRAVAYGTREPIARKCNLSTAQLTGRHEDFFDPAKRTRPVVAILSTVHGHEIEGCVASLNLVHLLETGTDLRGRAWPELRALAARMRIVVVPIAQADGRVRSAVRNLVGGTHEDMLYYGQGQPCDPAATPTLKDWCLRTRPVPLDSMVFLGGYYNDAGVNMDAEDFFSSHVSPETRSLIDLVRDETPDCFLVLHTHGPGPWIAAPNAYVSPRVQQHQARIGQLVAERHQRDGLRPKWRPAKSPLAYFNLPTALHHVCGGLPLAFEFPHGLAKEPYTFEEILDIGLTMFEEVFRYVEQNRDGLREPPERR